MPPLKFGSRKRVSSLLSIAEMNLSVWEPRRTV
jgi:hypothetical protein